ncbi:MAG: hypothetical protein A2854_00100 [Parcubacteria group bacterium RIFCSPHIGHO2_01_FULL_56_18]|nr:MAG: hypothetical protein A2854_00100 [Parcubacteria group bacterium RIFCSPHIGHO2_01_FULL_56_18]
MEALFVAVFLVGVFSGAAIIYGHEFNRPIWVTYGLVPNALLALVTAFLTEKVLFYQFLSAWGFGVASPLLGGAALIALATRRVRMKKPGS